MRTGLFLSILGLAVLSAPAFAQDTITLEPGMYSGTTVLKAKSGGFTNNSSLGPVCLTSANNTVGWADYVPLTKTIKTCKTNVISRSEGHLNATLQCNLSNPAGFQQIGVGTAMWDNKEIYMEFDGYLGKQGEQSGIPHTVEVSIKRTGDCG